MNTRLTKLSLSLLGIIACVATDAIAATSNPQAEINAITKRTQMLDKEINSLKQQIVQIRVNAQPSNTQSNKTVKQTSTMPIGQALVDQGHANPVIADMPTRYRKKLTTTTSPLKLLKERQKFAKAIKKHRLTPPSGPSIEVGGGIIGAAALRKSYIGRNSSDINLAAANMSVAVEANPWVAGIMKFTYDARGFSTSTSTLPYRVENSRIFINTAAVTVGNLQKSPVYFSMGQMVLPFGHYTGTLPSLASRLGKTLQRTLVLGFQQQGRSDGFTAAIYGFRGDSRTVTDDRINNGGANIAYMFNNPTIKIEASASIIANIADSAGMQNTRAPFVLFDNWEDADEEGDEDLDGVPQYTEDSFAGFGKTSNTEILVHRVPGVDVYSKFTIKDISLFGEYTAATRSFDINNLQFNDSGARPQAYTLEAAYNFRLAGYKTVASVGFSRSYAALPLNMPERSFNLGLRSTLTKYITAGLIYNHDKNYGLGNIAYGQGVPVLGDRALGCSSSSLTAQLGLKF